MAFTVEDFQDLLRLLAARPEWRAELRRLLVPDEVLELPSVVRQLADEVRLLADAQRRTEALVAQLVEAQIRAEERLGRVDERFDRVDERFDRVDERLDRLEAGQARLEQSHARTDARVAGLRGDNLERRYRDHVAGYFGRLVRRARVVGADELDDLLDEGLAAGLLDDDSVHDIRLADLVVRGRRPGEEQETYLVVEVSGVVEPSDVERAARRAALLGRVRPAVAVVGGEEITPEATDLAQVRDVRRIGNGRLEPPIER